MAPRRPGGGSQAVPKCQQPRRVVKLAAGATIRERWEADWYSTHTLDAVGSQNLKVRVDVVEARAERRLRVEAPASAVLDHPPRASGAPSSPGQLYDLLLEHRGLRSWLAAQPARSWRSAELTRPNSKIQFSAVTSGYERAVLARARPDGSNITVWLPRARDRIRSFRSRPATLPSGVRLIGQASDWKPTRDVIAGRLTLPSGRVIADGFPRGQSQPLEYRVAPGAYPVHVTLAHRGRQRFEEVALATLVVSGHRPVRWRRIGGIGVDGGVGAFTSLEGARALDRIHRERRRGLSPARRPRRRRPTGALRPGLLPAPSGLAGAPGTLKTTWPGQVEVGLQPEQPLRRVFHDPLRRVGVDRFPQRGHRLRGGHVKGEVGAHRDVVGAHALDHEAQ
jgi:hypothetical protein